MDEPNSQNPAGPPEWLQDVVDRYRAKPSPSEIRRTVRRALEELDYSQAELAEIFGGGVNQQAISRWANHPFEE